MSDPREMLQAARNERAHAQALLDKWNKVVLALEDAMGERSDSAHVVATVHEHNGGGDLSEMTAADAVATILTEARQPLLVADLVDQLQARGFRRDLTPRKVRTNIVSVMVRRRDRFRKAGVARYGLAAQ